MTPEHSSDRVPASPSAVVDEPRIGRSISLDHAAELLGVSRRTIYNRIREGRLLTIRTRGGSQRVLLTSVHSDPRIARQSAEAGPDGDL